MSEKTMFDKTIVKIQTAFQLLEDAKKELETIGIKVNSVAACGVDLIGSPNRILLRSGINKVSTLAEEEIKDDLFIDKTFGYVMLDGFYFDQQKLPVERQDRYA